MLTVRAHVRSTDVVAAQVQRFTSVPAPVLDGMAMRKVSVAPSPTADGIQPLVRAVTRQLAVLAEQKLEPGLYVVATPIGNLSDITLRALHVLCAADVICAEDTRHSRRLLDHYTITTRLRPYHDHSSARDRQEIVDILESGGAVALISDAGTPLVSDPGYKLVRDAAEAGANVIAVPGASAVLAALTAAGLPTDCFLFAGFLPPKTAQRRKRIASLGAVATTLVFYEAPQRLAASLTDLALELGATREAAVARELTKRFEEVSRGTLGSLAAAYADADVKGECVILVGPPVEPGDVPDAEIIARLEAALVSQSKRDAVREVSDDLGVARKRVYDLALGLEERDT